MRRAHALAPLAASLALLAASCTSTGPGPAGPQSAPPAPPAEAAPPPPPLARVAGAVDYQVDAAHSQLRLLVYRDGPLAAHGHNHVIVDGAVAGWIRAGRQLPDSAFYLQFAPADFVVDPPEARAEEGADFAAPVGDDARAGTRRNLLGPAQLDAEHHPLIVVNSVRVRNGAAGAAPVANLRVTIAGRTRTLDVPFTYEREARTLHVRADFPLKQTDLGLEPLRVLLGQLQVRDEMRVKLDVVAFADQSVAFE